MAAVLILWTDERAWSIQSINTIVKPKKMYGEIYRRGEAVEARYSGQTYPGVIIDIAGQGDRDKLKAKGVDLESFLSSHSDVALPERVLEYFQLQNAGDEKPSNSDTDEKAVNGETFAQGATQDVVTQATFADSEEKKTEKATGPKYDSAVNNGDRESIRDHWTGKSNQGVISNSADYMLDLTSPIKSRDKRIRSLESEVKDLKSDLRSIKKKMKRMEEKFEEIVSNSSSSKTAPSSCLPQSSATVNLSNVEAPIDHTTDLLTSVSHLTEKDTQEIVKRLCLKVFTKTELIECSRTGKRSAKSQDGGRPAISSNKMLLLEKAVLEKCPGLTRELFFKKFENIQKMERRLAKNQSQKMILSD